MLRIYLPSSTNFKLCSDVPTVDCIDTWTFITIICPGTWVLTSGSLQMGLKWFVNLWDTGNWSKMICQPLGHLLGPGSWVSDPGPGTQDPVCGLAPHFLLEFYCVIHIFRKYIYQITPKISFTRYKGFWEHDIWNQFCNFGVKLNILFALLLP